MHFWAQKNQVLKSFQPSLPLFLTKFPPNCPYILLVHVLGCHWYLLGCSRSENMPFLTILLNLICQSRPKMGQNHNFECKNDIFGFQWDKYYQKTVMLGLYWSSGVKIAVFESKTAFLGSDNSGFEAVFTFQTPILD